MRVLAAGAASFAVTLATLALPAQAADLARITLGPYVQDVGEAGFTVAFETDRPAGCAVVVGGARVETQGTRHEARVSDLEPGIRYTYRVLVEGAPAAEGEVSTFARSGPLTFLVFGDTRDDSAGALARAMAADHPDLLLGTGDLVDRGDDEAAWSAFFASAEPLLRSVPLYPAAGNHELWRDSQGAHYRRFFVLPEGGRERRYYSFRASAVRFIALDGNQATGAPNDPQTAWLSATLETSAREGDRHVFVFLHQPPFSTGVHCGAAPVERDWVRLFERYRVRAVFAGHDHAYERLSRNGVRYFVSGGGGAPLYDERDDCPAWDRAARRRYLAVHHYLRVQVSGDEVEVDALSPSGGAPLEVSRFRAGEPLAASEAPPISGHHARPHLVDAAIRSATHGWPIAALLLFGMVVAGGVYRRRRT